MKHCVQGAARLQTGVKITPWHANADNAGRRKYSSSLFATRMTSIRLRPLYAGKYPVQSAKDIIFGVRWICNKK